MVTSAEKYPKFINEYWTSRQRQANSLHEISYRGCFKAQLPRFFIELLTCPGDTVYDPFGGRGTTALEAAILGRNIISNDINPLSKILSYPRLRVPDKEALRIRLSEIKMDYDARADRDLSMFFHPKTEAEILSLKNYLSERKKAGKEDDLDSWIRMVATNRLTGHSPGFFSVYTLPPNQAALPQSQIKINEKLGQKPEYRDVRGIIMKKSVQLTKDVPDPLLLRLLEASANARFLTTDARLTHDLIEDESVHLTVTSPPFLDVVQYADDNWLRCWFNSIDSSEVSRKITRVKTVEQWSLIMRGVFQELYRITKKEGWVAFEVGEVRNGKIRLDEHVIPIGLAAGFNCIGTLINEQRFTKTANIWGIKNNDKGTNTNRIVLFTKESNFFRSRTVQLNPISKEP